MTYVTITAVKSSEIEIDLQLMAFQSDQDDKRLSEIQVEKPFSGCGIYNTNQSFFSPALLLYAPITQFEVCKMSVVRNM